MKHLFEYSILRYTHDAVTQEFVNIGVLLYSAQINYLDVKVSTRYRRVSRMFNGIDPSAYRQNRSTIEKAVKRVKKNLDQGSLTDGFANELSVIIKKILPENDASLSFSEPKQGVAESLENELDYIFNRIVDEYAKEPVKTTRTDQDVWSDYRTIFRRKNILQYLERTTIKTQMFPIEFDHAYKNERWHPVEPVSFDLSQSSYIHEKAARWIGKAVTLATSDQIGTLFILSGKPSEPSLVEAYEIAKKGLEQITQGITVKFIDEDNADSFTEDFAKFILDHNEAVLSE